jgi:hypothetical protein
MSRYVILNVTYCDNFLKYRYVPLSHFILFMLFKQAASSPSSKQTSRVETAELRQQHQPENEAGR